MAGRLASGWFVWIAIAIHLGCSTDPAPDGNRVDSGSGGSGASTASSSASGGGGEGAGAGGIGGQPAGKVPIFVAQGNVGRTMVSCDDGQTWVGNHSWDIDGDPLMCGMKQDVTCFEGMCSYLNPNDGTCIQMGCCNDTPDVPEGVAFGNETFAGVWSHGGIPGAIRTSTDGIEWVTRGTSNSFSIAFGGGRFVASGNPETAWSTDGVTWTDGGKAEFNTTGSPVRSFGYGETQGGGRFVSVSAGNGRDILVSSDGGLSWWRPKIIPDDCVAGGTGNGGGGVLAGNGVLLIVDQSGNACRSTDGGETWSVSKTGLTAIYSDGVWTGSEFLYWGHDMPNTASPAIAMISSADGETWTSTPMVTATRIGPVARSDSGTFVALPYLWDGYDKQHFLRSTDGVTWTDLPTTSFVQSHPIFRVAFGYASPSSLCPAP